MKRKDPPIEIKANRAWNYILIALLLIFVRSWHLSIVQHERGVAEARRPQKRTAILHPERGTICDRFDLPLALNKVQHNVAVVYGQIRQLPSASQRRTHVRGLAQLLGEVLDRDSNDVEDLIHSRAALLPNTPFVIAEAIDEETYFRLKMMEREWLGLQVERVPRRVYPQGRTACDVVGHLGAISSEEYRSVIEEMRILEEYLTEREGGVASPPPFGLASPMAARQRLLQLKERAYTISDRVGRAGIEAAHDAELRGYRGLRSYQVDIFGNFLRELPEGRAPLSGQKIVLTLSSELQAYAEQLLALNERIRDGSCREFDPERQRYHLLPEPFIKGGAIVAMDPGSGEILALASYPRYDPNDFATGSTLERFRWLETDDYIGAIWDGKCILKREDYSLLKGGWFDEELPLTWECFLELAIGKECPLAHATVGEALALQDEELVTRQQFLHADLSRLVVNRQCLSQRLQEHLSAIPLSTYRHLTQAGIQVLDCTEEMARRLFHDLQFRTWREREGKAFLREKRREEGRYARPYLDYFEAEERRQFALFWERMRWCLSSIFVTGDLPPQPWPAELIPYFEHFGSWASELAAGAHTHAPWHRAYSELRGSFADLPPELVGDFWRSFRRFRDLDQPLWGRHRGLRPTGLLRDLAASFYPRYGFGYGRSHAFRQAAPQGSVFKVVTAYEALMQRYAAQCERGGDLMALNPLTIVDRVRRGSVGTDLKGREIPQVYKGGRLLRTQRRNAGEIELTRALEVSSNTYFGLLCADHLKDPQDLNRAASELGFGERTGVGLPGEYAGHLPEDLSENQTGLYAYSCGQHSLVVTPLQTAAMLSSLANGGTLFRPRIVSRIAGREPEREVQTLFSRPDDRLSLLGIETPLFTAAQTPSRNEVTEVPFGVQRTVSLPPQVRSWLCEGMRRGTMGEHGHARPSAVRGYGDLPWIVRDYRLLHEQIIGKTGTAERVERTTLQDVHTYNHIWFGGICFPEPQLIPFRFETPELVVIVYLRFGSYGHEAPPLAAQMLKKWREIRAKHLD